jgi:hypothetical protein
MVHFLPFCMRKIAPFTIGTATALFLLLWGTAVAQSRCDTVRVEDGEGEYQVCLRDEREERAKQLVDVYRLQVDHQKKIREVTYEQRRTKAEILWKQADFDLERQVQNAEQQISLLRLSNGDNPEIRRLEVRIDELNQRRDLLGAQKDRMIDLYDRRQDMEFTYLDMQFQRYELSVRGFTPLNYEW